MFFSIQYVELHHFFYGSHINFTSFEIYEGESNETLNIFYLIVY